MSLKGAGSQFVCEFAGLSDDEENEVVDETEDQTKLGFQKFTPGNEDGVNATICKKTSSLTVAQRCDSGMGMETFEESKPEHGCVTGNSECLEETNTPLDKVYKEEAEFATKCHQATGEAVVTEVTKAFSDGMRDFKSFVLGQTETNLANGKCIHQVPPTCYATANVVSLPVLSKAQVADLETQTVQGDGADKSDPNIDQTGDSLDHAKEDSNSNCSEENLSLLEPNKSDILIKDSVSRTNSRESVVFTGGDTRDDLVTGGTPRGDPVTGGDTRGDPILASPGVRQQRVASSSQFEYCGGYENRQPCFDRPNFMHNACVPPNYHLGLGDRRHFQDPRGLLHPTSNDRHFAYHQSPLMSKIGSQWSMQNHVEEQDVLDTETPYEYNLMSGLSDTHLVSFEVEGETVMGSISSDEITGDANFLAENDMDKLQRELTESQLLLGKLVLGGGDRKELEDEFLEKEKELSERLEFAENLLTELLVAQPTKQEPIIIVISPPPGESEGKDNPEEKLEPLLDRYLKAMRNNQQLVKEIKCLRNRNRKLLYALTGAQVARDYYRKIAVGLGCRELSKGLSTCLSEECDAPLINNIFKGDIIYCGRDSNRMVLELPSEILEIFRRTLQAFWRKNNKGEDKTTENRKTPGVSTATSSVSEGVQQNLQEKDKDEAKTTSGGDKPSLAACASASAPDHGSRDHHEKVDTVEVDKNENNSKAGQSDPNSETTLGGSEGNSASDSEFNNISFDADEGDGVILDDDAISTLSWEEPYDEPQHHEIPQLMEVIPPLRQSSTCENRRRDKPKPLNTNRMSPQKFASSGARGKDTPATYSFKFGDSTHPRYDTYGYCYYDSWPESYYNCYPPARYGDLPHRSRRQSKPFLSTKARRQKAYAVETNDSQQHSFTVSPTKVKAYTPHAKTFSNTGPEASAVPPGAAPRSTMYTASREVPAYQKPPHSSRSRRGKNYGRPSKSFQEKSRQGSMNENHNNNELTISRPWHSQCSDDDDDDDDCSYLDLDACSNWFNGSPERRRVEDDSKAQGSEENGDDVGRFGSKTPAPDLCEAKSISSKEDLGRGRPARAGLFTKNAVQSRRGHSAHTVVEDGAAKLATHQSNVIVPGQGPEKEVVVKTVVRRFKRYKGRAKDANGVPLPRSRGRMKKKSSGVAAELPKSRCLQSGSVSKT